MRRWFQVGVASVGLAAVLAVAAPAGAWSDYFQYTCYTYVTYPAWPASPQYQADRYGSGSWGTYPRTSSVYSQTNGTYSSNPDNSCYYSNGFTVEASNYQRPYIGTYAQDICDINYTGYDNDGNAVAVTNCSDNIYWNKIYVLMGHRAWFSGQYRDAYTEAVLCRSSGSCS